MNALGRKLLAFDNGAVVFQCPGCMTDHVVNVKPIPGSYRRVWRFNGDGDRPTFTPSILVRTGCAVDPAFVPEDGDPPEVCHSFVTDGRIQFLGDCTHELAGQTVELPDWSTS